VTDKQLFLPATKLWRFYDTRRLSVCLSLCQQDISKLLTDLNQILLNDIPTLTERTFYTLHRIKEKCGQMFMNFLGGVGIRIRNIRLDFGTDPCPDPDLDPESFSTFPPLRDRAI